MLNPSFKIIDFSHDFLFKSLLVHVAHVLVIVLSNLLLNINL